MKTPARLIMGSKQRKVSLKRLFSLAHGGDFLCVALDAFLHMRR